MVCFCKRSAAVLWTVVLAMTPCALMAQGGFSGPGRYIITNVNSGKVLDLDRNDQTTVLQFSPRGTPNQAWEIQPARGSFFYVRNGMNGYALDAVSGGNADRVACTPFNGGPSQQWRIDGSRGGAAILINSFGRVIDIPGGATGDGIAVHIFDRNDGANQRFTLVRAGWNGGWNGNGGGVIACASNDGRRVWCPADTRGGVQMMRQVSQSPCIQGQTWGFDGRGVWVDRGCRAEFQIGTGGYGNGGAGSGAALSCSSDDGGRVFCPADTRGGVQLVRQRSQSPCIQGQTWGFDRRGIWVDRGCRADFQTGAGGNWDGGAGGNGPTISCSSNDGGRVFCPADTRGGVQMIQQRSQSPCIQGTTWGYDRRGVWVDRGCRADFQLGSR